MDEPSDSPLCEVCHQNTACHFTHVIMGDTKSSRKLCGDCFQSTATAQEKSICEQALAARCRFCGSKACGISSDYNFLTESMETLATCLPCQQLHSKHLLAVLDKVPENLSVEDQVKAARQAKDSADEHVRDWLRRYGS